MKISVILVSYNTKKLTLDCLTSLYKSNYRHLEIFVVDNNSNDGSISAVAKQFPKVKIIKNKDNLGFGTANNQAAKIATGDLILFLNTDTLVPKDLFEKMSNFFTTHKKAGIASSRLIFPTGKIQQNGGSLPTLINIFAWQFFLDEIPILTHIFSPYQQENPEFYLSTHKTGWVSGAAMWIRKTTYDQVGGFDENIFMYGEDIEICMRAQKSKWQVWTVSETQVIHLAHQSSDKSRAIIGEYKGLKYLLVKHKPRQILYFRLVLKLGTKVRSIIFKLLKKQKYTWYEEAFNLV